MLILHSWSLYRVQISYFQSETFSEVITYIDITSEKNWNWKSEISSFYSK